ncbi:MAG: tripartite tricarboxylate transporter substrate binding protein [Betaproteobacteria bacterium]|nr:tripartite tricarboxylate transporter substrate binding protein [Betaproteobacteria bacterium]
MRNAFSVCAGIAAGFSALVFVAITQVIPAHAQAPDAAKGYPARPIRIIVPFPPGGSNDILGRFIGQRLTERLGQQAVIDNRGGADGIIGTDIAARATPDGYTLLVVSTSYSMNPAVHKLPYDPLKSLAPVSLIGTGPNVLATNPALPVKSVKELIALAKSKPGRLRYASSGIGGFNHFGGELFKSMAGVDMLHVPYKGGGPAMIDVISGQVEVLFGTLIQTLPHIRTGKLRALGVGGVKRSPALPAVPTIAESGVTGYDGSIWWGILGPAGMPRAIVTRLNTEIGAILRDPETAKRLSAEAAEPVIAPPEEFGKLIASNIAKWRRVAREASISAQ